MAVPETKNLPPKADRKGLDAHPAPARHQEMAELVDKHDDRQDEQEWDQDGKKAPHLLEDPAQGDACSHADFEVE